MDSVTQAICHSFGHYFVHNSPGGMWGSPPATPSKYNGKIDVGLDSDAVTLDPLKSSAFVDRQVMLNLYDTLVRLDEHNAIVPDLATAWSYTSPTQLVFTLRSDVKFQDGTPFNADAVVFNINRNYPLRHHPASVRCQTYSL